MKALTHLLFLLAFAHVAQAAIYDSKKRGGKIAAMNAFVERVTPIQDEELMAKIGNPFSRAQAIASLKPEETDVQSVEGPDKVLALLANQIKPSGSFKIGNDYFLMFKEKKVKEGSAIEIKRNGLVYNVTISSVSNAEYTISYQGAEVTKKLK